MSPLPVSARLRTSFRHLWSSIEHIGRHPGTGGYRRFAWTNEDLTLREWFAGECQARGLDLTTDRFGNQWAWWGDPDAAVAAGRAGIVTGSHLDSVPDGGAFDGPLGVVSALLALDVLRETGFEPERPIGVAHFLDEEGARFGVACMGSRVLTGAISAQRALALSDAAGTTMAEAMRAAGHAPEQVGTDPETSARIGAFIELHVEQGRHLVDVPAPVAVGSGIWPHGRWRITVPGEANHAGTTRLEDRNDAMLGLAAAVIAARRAAEQHDGVATVGKVAVTPGGVNAIPSQTIAWLDARAPREADVQDIVAEITQIMDDFDATVEEESWTPSTDFDERLVPGLARHLGGIPVIGTGAGHDAGILANAGHRTAMLFVRNPTGSSHTPQEFAEEEDCLAGVGALSASLRALAGARGAAADNGSGRMP